MSSAITHPKLSYYRTQCETGGCTLIPKADMGSPCSTKCKHQSTKAGSFMWCSAILNYYSRFPKLSKLRTSSSTLYSVIHWVIYKNCEVRGRMFMCISLLLERSAAPRNTFLCVLSYLKTIVPDQQKIIQPCSAAKFLKMTENFFLHIAVKPNIRVHLTFNYRYQVNSVNQSVHCSYAKSTTAVFLYLLHISNLFSYILLIKIIL